MLAKAAAKKSNIRTSEISEREAEEALQEIEELPFFSADKYRLLQKLMTEEKKQRGY